VIRQFVGLGLDAGDTQDKFQEPNSKNQEARRLGDTLRWRHAMLKTRLRLKTRFAEEFNDSLTNDSMTFSETT